MTDNPFRRNELTGLYNRILKIKSFDNETSPPGSWGQVVKPIKFFSREREIIRHHHEHYDGAGYPDGIAGEEIPLIARILTVADSYDAMTSNRPYRHARSHEYAVSELNRCASTQFDPEVVRAFLSTRSGKEGAA